jgi:hypothetical protein
MRYFFHIFGGSKFSPDEAGSNLPSLEYAKRMAVVVADELKKGGEFCRWSLVIVSDENGKKLFECSASQTISDDSVGNNFKEDPVDAARFLGPSNKRSG